MDAPPKSDEAASAGILPAFHNRVAIVTGGASGIGRALCDQLAAAGARVVVADIDRSGAERAAESLRQRGAQAQAVSMDVSDSTQVDRLVGDAFATHGRLDFMFNNAGIAAVGELRDGNLADFRRVVEVNLFGVVHGTMAAYRVMLRQGFGHIVNVSSLTGLMPTPILSAYSTTKWAIIGFSQAVRVEAAGLGVKVSVACPGLVRTDIVERNAFWNVRKDDYLAWLPWQRWMLTPAQAANRILRGTARNQDIVIFPFSASLGWRVYRLCPALFTPILRRTLEGFRRLRLKEASVHVESPERDR
jgi:NAD(P)-dependent dehydrogenase (short-subunit alcohol dehydrogenase family)